MQDLRMIFHASGDTRNFTLYKQAPPGFNKIYLPKGLDQMVEVVVRGIPTSTAKAS